jgi:hypothetical protein
MAKPGAVLFLGILLPNIHFFNEGCKWPSNEKKYAHFIM